MLLDEVVRDRLRSVSVTNGVSDDCCAGSTGDSERGNEAAVVILLKPEQGQVKLKDSELIVVQ